MTHEELREMAGAYVLGALDPGDRAAFEAHLPDCAACQADVRAFAPVVDALAQTAPDRQPSAALRDRVVGLEPHHAGGIQFQRDHIQANVLPWFLAAAAVIGLAMLTPYTLQLRNQTQQLAAAVRDLTARLGETDRQLMVARGEVSLLAAPDVKRVDLRGQAAAPQAGARAYWSRSRGVYFVASDLPPVPSGKDYQLWFVTPAGPVSASVFKPDDRGRAELIGQVPPGMGEPNAMAVTLEPAGGVPSPTGAMYLVGQATP